jgi:hypothetical protein
MNETEHHTPTTTAADRPKAGAGPRVLALIAALGLAFAAAVAILAMVLIGDTTPCADVTGPADLNEDGECFDGSSTKKLIALVLGWPGAILLAASVLLALGFTITGRGGRRLIAVAVAGAVLFGLSILAGSV